MLVFSDARLAFLAVPKTGTTAVEMALRSRADIAFLRHRKHMNAQRFAGKVAPFLNSIGTEVETLAVMRNPIEQIRSWYKYRASDRLKGSPKSTEGRSFDDFVLAVISDDPPEFAGIGSQFNFLTNRKGMRAVDHLFSYENQTAFRSFLETRLGQEIEFKIKNVSPDADAPLSAEVEAKLRQARAAEFALYDGLRAADGYLGPNDPRNFAF